MPNLPHPLEDAQFALHEAIQRHITLSLRDGEIDEHERHLHDTLHGIKASLGTFVGRDKFAAAVKKGVDPGPYLKHLAHVAGYDIGPHESEPRGRVTPFPSDRTNHG